MHRRARNIHVVPVLLVAFAGCAKGRPGSEAHQTTHGSAAADTSGKPAWTDPPGWTKRPPSTPMRVAEYGVPRAEGDDEDAECSVTTFGAGQGGSAEMNIERWVRQFDPSDAAIVRKDAKDVGGMHATTLEISGTYTAMAMPGQKATSPKKGQRLIATVLEAPSGTYFFKLVGPDATVRKATKAYDDMIASAHR